MPSEEQELRIVPRAQSESELPAGLRLLKSIKTTNKDTYLVFLPGLAPPGFKLSLHPSGEFHLKSRDLGTFARVNLVDLIEAAKSGALDDAMAAVLKGPKAGRPASGFIAKPEAIPSLTAPSREEGHDVDIDVEGLLDTFTPIEISKTETLPEHLDWLRREGYLPVRGIVLLHVEGSEEPTVFVNMVESRASAGPPVDLPESRPMRRTLETALNQLREYGGIFVTFPEGEQMRALAHRAGLGELYDGVADSFKGLDESQLESAMQGLVRELQLVAAETAADFMKREPIRLQPHDSGKAADVRAIELRSDSPGPTDTGGTSGDT